MTPSSISPRVHQIDLLRGLIIVFMMIDHGLYYCGGYNVNDPMLVSSIEPIAFFSRFVSHFCAPLFVFLAGVSAAITESKYASTNEFAHNLIIRGVILIIFEFTIVSWSWSFNPLFPMLYAQIISAIGWGFIVLGLLRLLGIKVIFIVGFLLVTAHNLFDGVHFESNTVAHYIWSFLHQKNVLALPFGAQIRTTYPVIPVIGLMCLAYIAGRYYKANQFNEKVHKQAAWLGLGCLALYSVLRGFNLYGDMSQFYVGDTWLITLMSFLNPTKYPLSLQFILLTVGTGLILLCVLSKTKATFSANFLQALGKTSMFSYLTHLYLLHAVSWLLIPVLGYKWSDMTYGETLVGLPEGYGMSFPATYCMIAFVLMLTTLLARRYYRWKCAHKNNFIAKYI